VLALVCVVVLLLDYKLAAAYGDVGNLGRVAFAKMDVVFSGLYLAPLVLAGLAWVMGTVLQVARGSRAEPSILTVRRNRGMDGTTRERFEPAASRPTVPSKMAVARMPPTVQAFVHVAWASVMLGSAVFYAHAFATDVIFAVLLLLLGGSWLVSLFAVLEQGYNVHASPAGASSEPVEWQQVREGKVLHHLDLDSAAGDAWGMHPAQGGAVPMPMASFDLRPAFEELDEFTDLIEALSLPRGDDTDSPGLYPPDTVDLRRITIADTAL
jgi:hypothetical protein